MLIESLLIQSGLGLASILLAELVRDFYHVAGHYWQPIQASHTLHHKAYRRDLSIVSQAAYCKAQLYNDVPEAAVMVGVVGIIALLVHSLGMVLGVVYSAGFLVTALARSQGWLLWTDYTHEPGDLTEIPSVWRVNRSYHWRHHFDQGNAYFCGHFTMVDKMLGTSLSLKGKVIAITGASGTMGQALMRELAQQGAKIIALTTSDTLQPDPSIRSMQVIQWQPGQEEELGDRLRYVDILILNHGMNVYGDRTPQAIEKALDVNALSAWRMAEVFFSTVDGPTDRATKELWVNTSEAEVNPALSPLYELSKRLMGDILTLRRLDSPCVIRKIILGPFKSNLNPYGIMPPTWVAKAVVALAKRDVRNIIVTVNPLTYLAFPVKEMSKSLYFRAFSKGDRR
ncbi:MAG: bifunctional sterol desaturase/short chain dehydrogenase [Synechococcales cyanobacterium T60_A2020_003]|nr:bifunctional sterol desaturase/short chain dehydrogenase [Synechococcales cyanobacterium T60_A2020_003]